MKDKKNILNHTQWSAGEYDNNITTFNNNTDASKILLTNEWSKMGESSLKITKIAESGFSVYTILNYTEHDKKVVFSARVKTGNNSAYIHLIEQQRNTSINNTRVNIPSNTICTISTSLITSNSNDRLRLQFENNLHVDNISLIES